MTAAEELARAHFAACLARLEVLLEERVSAAPQDLTTVRLPAANGRRGWHLVCYPQVDLTAGREERTWYCKLFMPNLKAPLQCPMRSLDPSVREAFLDQCAILVAQDLQDRLAELLAEFSADAGTTGEAFLAEAGTAVARQVHES